MSPAEVVGRVGDRVRQERWVHRLPEDPARVAEPCVWAPRAGSLAPGTASAENRPQDSALLRAAKGLLEGRWELFGRQRTDVFADVDYFLDFVNGRRAPDGRFFGKIDHRDESTVGNVKFVWELGRQQHLCVLAAAYYVSGDDRYAQRVISEIHHFVASNPFPMGIHWTSGIEIGMRLTSWSLCRLLLGTCPDVEQAFEESSTFVAALGRHQQWLEAFPSHGSSANNHLIAELSGQYVASTVFQLFEESDTWRTAAGARLAAEFDRQTLSDGHNCELASDYHLFVTELLILPALIARVTGDSIDSSIQSTLERSIDALASIVDERLRPPRFGDSDDAFGLLLDAPTGGRVADILEVGKLLVGRSAWWPESSPDWNRASILRHLFALEPLASRPTKRRDRFDAAGISVLRSDVEGEELLLYFDHGPLGYLSTAAHGHADALSIELRHGGVEVLADPGTYCYHGEPQWRDYFRSTFAHNTVTLGGRNQSDMGGPFLWTRHANAKRLLGEASPLRVSALHTGYVETIGLVHERSVEFDLPTRSVLIDDHFHGDGDAPVKAQVVFHLGPEVSSTQSSQGHARLTWKTIRGDQRATLTSDESLEMNSYQGEVSLPIAGWYSPHFGQKIPTTTVVLSGEVKAGTTLRTRLILEPADNIESHPRTKRDT